MEEKKTIGPTEKELTEEELDRVTGGESGGVTEIKMFLVDRDMVCDHFYKGSSPFAFASAEVSAEERCCGICHYFLCPQGEREGVCSRCNKFTYRQRGQRSPGMA